MPSKEIEQLELILRKAKAPVSSVVPDLLSVKNQRANLEALQAGLKMPADIHKQDVHVNGVPARWLDAPDANADRVMMYLHGGGYFMGSVDTHQELMGRLSRACRCRVFGIDYRLAPEAPFPAALEDALAGYRGLLGQGYSPDQIIIAGDSAGGGLAVATLVVLRDNRDQLPAGAVLFSPWVDLTLSGDSHKSRAELDPTVVNMGPMALLYAQDKDPAEPLISPLFAELSQLPPMLIQVGDLEVLLDDSVTLAARVNANGGKAALRIFNGAFHVFQSFPKLPETQQALEDVTRFCQSITRKAQGAADDMQ